MKNFLKDNIHIILSILLGIALFGMVYGYNIVNPTYDDWIYHKTGMDINQHYIGWQYFRNTPWRYPIGMLDGLSTEPVSIVYTDSIPIFAIIFKIFSNILPETFQYFGIWGVLCFILQSLMSTLIIHKFTQNKIYSLIGSTFFTVSYVVLIRMFGHTALAGNWIILLSMWLFIHSEDFKSPFNRNLAWILTVMLSIMIHMYFLPMVLCVMCGDILQDILRKNDIFDCIIRFSLSILGVVIEINAMGMFNGTKSKLSSSSFGKYVSNLNTYYNPFIGDIKFTKKLPVVFDNFEGSAYIGFGLILGFILMMVIFIIVSIKDKFHSINNVITENWQSIISGMAILLISVFFAITPNITFNDKILFSFRYPEKLEELMSIFRANGRFIWISMYFLMFLIIISLYKLISNKKICLSVISIFLIFQFVDYSSWIKLKHTRYSSKIQYDLPLKDNLWNELGNRCSHIEIVPVSKDYLQQTDFYYTLAIYGLKYNLDLSSFIVARSSYEDYLSHSNEIINQLQSNIPNYDTIYIFNDTKYIPNVDNFKSVTMDNYIVGYYIQ